MDMTKASIWHLNEVKVQVRSRKNAIGSVSAKDSVQGAPRTLRQAQCIASRGYNVRGTAHETVILEAKRRGTIISRIYFWEEGSCRILYYCVIQNCFFLGVNDERTFKFMQ